MVQFKTKENKIKICTLFFSSSQIFYLKIFCGYFRLLLTTFGKSLHFLISAKVVELTLVFVCKLVKMRNKLSFKPYPQDISA
jgi:hypothetical protein